MWSSSQIEIQYDDADAAKLPLELISMIREGFDCCIDDEGRALTENKKLWIAIKTLINKGVIVRFVTTVNERNIAFCRELMKYGEVFHNDSIKGNFQIVDRKDYLCYITGNEVHARHKELHWQLFHTNFKSFVEIQQCLFDNLCSKATPAREKIKEIEKGIKAEFTDTINRASEIKTIVTKLLMSAKDEILLLFPTTNAFFRSKSSGLLNSLHQLPTDVTVRALVQVGSNNHKVTIRNELKQSHGQIQVQYVTKPLTSRIVTVVVDQVTSLAIEIDDDTKKTFEEASGTAIYSNSELIVSSCISIFETLWIQSEVNKQNKIKQAYFHMFKGLKMNDEYYIVDRREKEKEKKNVYGSERSGTSRK